MGEMLQLQIGFSLKIEKIENFICDPLRFQAKIHDIYISIKKCNTCINYAELELYQEAF